MEELQIGADIDLSGCVILPKSNEGCIKISGRGAHILNGTFMQLVRKNEEWPQHREFYMRVDPVDIVRNSYTDKRGYPASCGLENKDKNITIIIHGNKGVE